MAKKIVVLNGSPRAKGNTAALINAFTQGAQSAGNEVTCFNLQKMDIHPCLGCFGGGKNPQSPCVQKDDMDKIYPYYKEADVVVLASPLYFWNISGQLKCTFDRLFAVSEIDPNYNTPIKDCALLMAAGGQENDFEETVHYYNNLVKHLGWNNLGMVLADGVNDIGDIVGSPMLDRAEELGRGI